MNRACVNLPVPFKLEDCPGFEETAVPLATGNWVHLHKCSTCGQLWRIDEWDKYQVQFVVRIPAGQDWEQFDASTLQKQFLIQSRGGLSQEQCIWHGCQGKRVQGVVYCVEHLYQTGVKE
jgi:hypothetical protein